MDKLVHMVNDFYTLKQFRDATDVRAFYRAYGCNGLEVILGDQRQDQKILPDMVIGCHLLFYSDWLDFWRQDIPALNKKFGSQEVWQGFYRAKGREEFLAQFRRDLAYAQQMNVKYVVFHVSDVSIEEGYTYQWLHRDEEVIDAAAEVINLLFDGSNYTFDLLLENLWWPGLSLTNPMMTKRLLDQVHYPNKGLLLDTGHLMNTNLDLRSPEEACAYIHHILLEHGSLKDYIRGVHLHQSITGAYVKASFKQIPDLAADFYQRFAQGYRHILQIDTHQPWVASGVKGLIQEIAPEYLVYELVAPDRQRLAELLALQASIWQEPSPETNL